MKGEFSLIRICYSNISRSNGVVTQKVSIGGGGGGTFVAKQYSFNIGFMLIIAVVEVVLASS